MKLAAKEKGGTEQPAAMRFNQFLEGCGILVFERLHQFGLIHGYLCQEPEKGSRSADKNGASRSEFERTPIQCHHFLIRPQAA